MEITHSPQTFVFVHSAWLGGWAYEEVANRLRAQGHQVLCPDLSGHGTRQVQEDDPTLDRYVADLRQATEGCGPVVLVGHSFGGVVVSQFAERYPTRVRALVYLAAFMLPDGESFGTATAGASGSAVLDHLVFSPDRRHVWIDPAYARDAVAADVPPEAFAVAARAMVAEPTGPLLARLSLTEDGWDAIPRFYIRTTEDRAIPLPLQDAMIRNLGVHAQASLHTSHVPNFSAPDALAKVLCGFPYEEDDMVRPTTPPPMLAPNPKATPKG